MEIKAGTLQQTLSWETQQRLLAHIVDLEAKYVALLAKLDLDGGVTDTNYAALLTPTDQITN